MHAVALTESTNTTFFSGPKPVFHSMSKRNAHCQRQQEPITPQHEEIIKYIHECTYEELF